MGRKSPVPGAAWGAVVAAWSIPLAFFAFSIITTCEAVGISIYDPLSWSISYTVIIPGLWLVNIGAIWLAGSALTSKKKSEYKVPTLAEAKDQISTYSFYGLSFVVWGISMALNWYVYKAYGEPSNHYSEPNGSLEAERWLTCNLFSAIGNYATAVSGFYFARDLQSRFVTKYAKLTVESNGPSYLVESH